MGANTDRKLERGLTRRPHAASLIAVAAVLGIDANELIEGRGPIRG